MVKIIDFLQAEYLDGNMKAFTLDEIGSKIKLDISSSVSLWLLKSALPNNPRIKVHQSDGPTKCKFSFRAPLPVMSRKGLLKLLQEYRDTGRGSILVDDVRKSVPHADAILNSISDKIIRIQRSDKQEIIFFDDKEFEDLCEPGLKNLWHNVQMKDVTMAQIEDYLEKKGIAVVKSQNSVGDPATRQKRHAKSRKLQKQSNSMDTTRSQSNLYGSLGNRFINTHIEDLLINYDKNGNEQ